MAGPREHPTSALALVVGAAFAWAFTLAFLAVSMWVVRRMYLALERNLGG